MKPVPLFGSETIGATVSVGRAGEGNREDKKRSNIREVEGEGYLLHSLAPTD